VNEPAVSTQFAVAAQLCKFNVHSLRLVQLTPLPVKPDLQAHVNEPTVSMHVALGLQLCVASEHSLTLLHVSPLPV